MRSPSQHQRGVAVLTAMLVVTIGTIIAVNLMWTSTLDQRRTATALANDQGMMYALGAEAWAADILRLDLVESPDADHLGELWATEIPPLPVEGGFVIGRLEDLQGRFNLNNLVLDTGEEDEVMREQFERLLTLLEIDPLLAGAVVDWLDPDTDTRFPNGGEDDTYADSDPQYRTPNTMITSPTEVLAVAGFDGESYTRLAPYITALPRGTTLNVNTASDVLLASLSDDIDLSLAASLIDERAGADFVNIEDSFQGIVSEDMLPRIAGISDHFLLVGTVQIGVTVLTMRSVLQRNSSGLTRALFRSFGGE
jgi:general secretion pathway protein K